jgi:hypothetical protein
MSITFEVNRIYPESTPRAAHGQKKIVCRGRIQCRRAERQRSSKRGLARPLGLRRGREAQRAQAPHSRRYPWPTAKRDEGEGAASLSRHNSGAVTVLNIGGMNAMCSRHAPVLATILAIFGPWQPPSAWMRSSSAPICTALLACPSAGSSNGPSPGSATAVASRRTSNVTLANRCLHPPRHDPHHAQADHGKPFRVNPNFPERF